jgi:hypothetical protein
MSHEAFERASGILSSIVYASTLDSFEKSLTVLKSLYPPAFAYLEEVWLPVRQKWALYSTSKNINLGCISTSRVEGTHSVIKRHLSKKVRVEVLLLEVEDKIRRDVVRRERLDFCSQDRCARSPPEVLKFLPGRISSYAFGAILSNYRKSELYPVQRLESSAGESEFRVNENVVVMTQEQHLDRISLFTCNCGWSHQHLLPCAHVCAVARLAQIYIGEESISKRWLLSIARNEASTDIPFTPIADHFQSSSLLPSSSTRGPIFPDSDQPTTPTFLPPQIVASKLVDLQTRLLALPDEKAVHLIDAFLKALEDENEASIAALEGVVLPLVQCKGRPVSNKRLKSSAESSVKCGICKKLGHNRVTCPSKDIQ